MNGTIGIVCDIVFENSNGQREEHIIMPAYVVVEFPNSIIPLISARTAGFFGFLDSKISATLGKPPVISLVLDEALGILAIISPALTDLPFSILSITPTLRL